MMNLIRNCFVLTIIFSFLHECHSSYVEESQVEESEDVMEELTEEGEEDNVFDENFLQQITKETIHEICPEDRLRDIIPRLPAEKIKITPNGNSSQLSRGEGGATVPKKEDVHIDIDLRSDKPFKVVQIAVDGNVERIKVQTKQEGEDWTDPNYEIDDTAPKSQVDFGIAGLKADYVRLYPLKTYEDEDEQFLMTLRILVCKERDARLILDNDVVYSKRQYKYLFSNETKRKSGRVSYGGTYRTGVTFWPHGIVPYVIQQKDFSKDEMIEIREAMDVYEEATCVKFIPRTNQQNFVHIKHTNDGCYSMVGMHGGAQVLSLKSPGCRRFGTYLHELGHALGLLHEHQMPNRDYFLKYYDVNVNPRQMAQLKKYNPGVVQTYGGTYDLSSIMHYDVMSFSFDGKSQTLGTNDPWAIQYIGRPYSNILSLGDVRTVNHIYQCAVRWLCRTPCKGMTYHNKDCQCVSFNDHHHKYCKNERGLDEFCDSVALQSQCDPKILTWHKNCAKSCDFCPRYAPGQTALNIPAKCRNIYPYPEKCVLWAQKGLCNVPQNRRFMHRYCRLACGVCDSPIGKCPNLLANTVCDEKAANKRCGLETAKAKCRDSCGTCLWRKTDPSCRNNINRVACATFASKNKCEEQPYQMFTKCPSTCNRCYFNNGSCMNKLSDKHCFKMLRLNLCVDGPPPVGGVDLHLMTLRDCPRTCGKC